MGTIRLNSKVGQDGVLNLRVPLGAADANVDVVITIEPVKQNGNGASKDWHDFVSQTYGSCAGLGLEEPVDLPLQQREWPT